jgi:imidazolonepropionase-like amidohydrolase
MAALTLGAAFARADDDLAIVRATLIAAPHATPINNATIEIRNGRIAAIAQGATTAIPNVIDAGGRVVTAGLRSTHVHFTDPDLQHHAAAIDPELTAPILWDPAVRPGASASSCGWVRTRSLRGIFRSTAQ